MARSKKSPFSKAAPNAPVKVPGAKKPSLPKGAVNTPKQLVNGEKAPGPLIGSPRRWAKVHTQEKTALPKGKSAARTGPPRGTPAKQPGAKRGW